MKNSKSDQNVVDSCQKAIEFSPNREQSADSTDFVQITLGSSKSKKSLVQSPFSALADSKQQNNAAKIRLA